VGGADKAGRNLQSGQHQFLSGVFHLLFAYFPGFFARNVAYGFEGVGQGFALTPLGLSCTYARAICALFWLNSAFDW